jgi:hypothetical protein
MIEVTKQCEVTVNTDDLLEEVNESDIFELINSISDHFDNYRIDCAILNSITSIILNYNPDKSYLKTIDIKSLKSLLEIIKNE